MTGEDTLSNTMEDWVVCHWVDLAMVSGHSWVGWYLSDVHIGRRQGKGQKNSGGILGKKDKEVVL